MSKLYEALKAQMERSSVVSVQMNRIRENKKTEEEWGIFVDKCRYEDYIEAGPIDDPWEESVIYIE